MIKKVWCLPFSREQEDMVVEERYWAICLQSTHYINGTLSSVQRKATKTNKFKSVGSWSKKTWCKCGGVKHSFAKTLELCSEMIYIVKSFVHQLINWICCLHLPMPRRVCLDLPKIKKVLQSYYLLFLWQNFHLWNQRYPTKANCRSSK